MKKFTLTILVLGFWLLALNAQIANTDTTDAGVLINGVVWATRNVDAPGTFAQNPEDIGMLYQYDRNIGWSSNDPLIASNGSTTWNTTYSYSPVWQEENDPCPCGWRVPTPTELQSLVDAGSVFTDYYSHYDGGVCSGRIFGDYFNENFIFLRSYSARNNYGTLQIVSEIIAGVQPYWSNTRKEIVGEEFVFIYMFVLNSSNPDNYNRFAVSYGYGISAYPIRCVKTDKEEVMLSVEISPIASEPIVLGDAIYFTAIAKNQCGTAITNGIDYLWSLEQGENIGQDGIFIPTEAGTYKVICTAIQGTISASDTVQFSVTTTRLKEIESSRYSIFPNPVNSELIIENLELKINSMEICDVIGKTIYQIPIPQNKINVSVLNQGIYLLKISTDKGIIIEKFIKN